MKVPFNDLYRVNDKVLSKSLSAYERAIKKSSLILGEEVAKFEEKFSKFTKQKYSISCANGTDALELILRALNIGKGDEVIVPSNSFVDNDEYYLIDLEGVKSSITKNTKAIIGVNLYGQMCNVEELSTLAKKLNLYFIEDAAQSHGSFRGDLKVGDFSIATGYSFYPGKNLGGFSDSGAITTNNRKLSEKLIKLRNVGSKEKYIHDMVGFNSRISGLNAIVLSNKLNFIDEVNEERNFIANRYMEGLQDNKNIVLPKIYENNYHVWHLFVLRVKNRNMFIDEANKNGVQTLIHYPIPIHKQKAMQAFYVKNKILQNVERFSKKIVSIPMFPYMSNKEIEHVIKTVNKITI
jgi:dTDP-4-amino-4,6-dideoxygalactose transaminase